ncbi:MAG: type II secretion protein F [Micavibrio aeruginosavorus]|uniref:Type II secretion protein F n=1 Tax=Micavibrio aeruginosavorus TaxID=349221 RepID=A0A2W5PWV2_9BACT|nr:MAG: type II secretion protein F [Micavibrio aeruginosavorus]
MIDITTDFLIVVGSAVAAALSFAAFVFPFLQRGERKERYKNVIEKKRKALFEQTKEELNKKGAKNLSAKDSLSSFFRMQSMAGEYGEKVRVLLLQAGNRDPRAPMKYIISQIVLPIILVLFCMLILSKSEKEISEVMQMLILFLAAITGFYLPRILVKNAALKRIEDLTLNFPDALDMMLICVQGGIGLEQTVDKVAGEIAEYAPTLAEELGILSAEMAMLNDRRNALSEFGKRVGGYGKSFATALIQAEQYGTSISQALRVLADELRDIRMAKAEQKAASLPPKLTVPMIVFFLPALFIVILGPAGIEIGKTFN